MPVAPLLGGLGAIILLAAAGGCGSSVEDVDAPSSTGTGGATTDGATSATSGAGGDGAGGAGTGGSDATWACDETRACGRTSCNLFSESCPSYSCDGTDLCDTLSFGFAFGDIDMLFNPEAKDCVIQALEQGPAEGSVSISKGGNDPYELDTRTFYFLPGREVFISDDYDQMGLGGESASSVVGPLPLAEASAFSACSAIDDPQQLYDCIFDATDAVCP